MPGTEVRAFRSHEVLAPRLPTPNIPARLADAPWDLEIGCGVGLHPIRRAQAHPERLLVAIEKTHERFGKFARRLTRHPQLDNIVAVHADAVAWVTHHAPSQRFENIFILYPNPWPKAEHRNRRWLAMPFFGRLLECLCPGGTITLTSNLRPYIDEACALAQSAWNLRVEGPLLVTSEPRTHFERKYLERGEACYQAQFTF